MMEWLVGGGIGLVAGALGMGLLLWRERGKRADAESQVAKTEARAVKLESALKASIWSVDQGRKLLAERTRQLEALEAKLAELDAGQLLDAAFGVRGE